MIDGKGIVLLASGFDDPSDNGKTGNMIQTWVMLAEMEPHLAIKTGQDESICGGCPLRGDGTGKARPCYVRVYQAPLAIYRSWKAGNVAKMSSGEAARIIARDKRGFRLGSYGDPAAVPISVWQPMADAAVVRTGYTHQWRTAPAGFSSILMASVDTPEEYFAAQEMGWRTFRPRGENEEMLAGEFQCPAAEESGKRKTCSECGACDGANKDDRRASPSLVVHGAQKGQWEKAMAK